MGCSASLPSGNPINEGASLKLSTAQTHINGPIEEAGSSSFLRQQAVDAEKNSNLPTHTTDIKKQTENEENVQSGKSVEDNVGGLLKENEGKELTDKEIQSRKGPIEETGSSSLPLQQAVDAENSSNLPTHVTDFKKRTENEENVQSGSNVENDFGWLQKETEGKELTDKEIQSRKGGLFRLLNIAIKNIHFVLSSENEEEKWREVLLKQFGLTVSFVYLVQKIGPLPVDVLNKYRLEAGQLLSRTKSVCLICKVVTTGWQKCSKKQGSKAVEAPSEVALAALSTLWNFSDCSPEVTYDIVGDSNFLNTLRDILTSYLHERIQGEEMSEGESKMVGGSLSIIHNLSKVDENVTPLREHGFVAIISPYVDSKTKLDRFKTLASLANLIDEKESEILQGKDDLLKMFLETLETALQQTSRICKVNTETWSAWECTLTIHRLARNHANKTLLVQMGCLPPLAKLAKIGTVEETREALGAIWFLAFDKDNQKKMLEDKELNIVDLLIDTKEKWEDKTIKEAADGTLWLLREQLQKNEKYKDKVISDSNRDKVRDAVKRGSSIGATDTKDKKGHIMISYNWSHQKELIKIRDKLKANGYSVWMDIDNMGGSTLQAMAEAVELAHVVLICMSQKYKDSNNCKSEAEYTYQLQKNVVPLKMEKDYKPNGWLGFIVGAKKFYDFSGKYDFEAKFMELLKELSSLFREDGLETQDVAIIKETYEDTVDGGPVSITPRSVAHPGHQTSLDNLRNWTQKDVNDWLHQYNLSKEELGHLTGKDLAALVRMKDKASEYFYRCLEKKLKLESLSTMDTFIDALEHI